MSENYTSSIKNTVTIAEVAKILHANKDTIRAGIISGTLPIGSAVKTNKHYSYIIPRKRFELWLSGGDLKRTSLFEGGYCKKGENMI